MRFSSYLIILFSFISYSQDQIDLAYYLNDLDSYNQSIPKPSDYLLNNKEVGSSHISHDRLVQYMYALAEASDRITIENRGTTFEGRPLILLTISSKKNHENLEFIRTEHLSLNTINSSKKDLSNMPVVIYQGYSIHGNEPSGSNASMIYAYYLAASKSPEIIKALENTVILLDPSFNPDGLQRFAHWAIQTKACT